MAEMIYSLTKIIQLKPKAGVSENVARDWLPVTSIENGKRVTVRVPTLKGDYDVAEDSLGEECEYCYGLGYLKKEECNVCHGDGHQVCPTCHGAKVIDCEPCPECEGTGFIDEDCDVCHGLGSVWTPTDSDEGTVVCPQCGGNGHNHGGGVISVTNDGIVTLRWDYVTLGITDDGKLYAKTKIKEHGGLAADENKDLYVNVDGESITVNSAGQLCATLVPPYHEVVPSEEPGVISLDAAETFVSLAEGIVDNTTKNVIKIKLSVEFGITLDLENKGYESAVNYTDFYLKIAKHDGELLASEHFMWDQTRPMSNFHYDYIMDPQLVDVYLETASENEVFPVNTEITWRINSISC